MVAERTRVAIQVHYKSRHDSARAWCLPGQDLSPLMQRCGPAPQEGQPGHIGSRMSWCSHVTACDWVLLAVAVSVAFFHYIRCVMSEVIVSHVRISCAKASMAVHEHRHAPLNTSMRPFDMLMDMIRCINITVEARSCCLGNGSGSDGVPPRQATARRR